MYKFQRLSQLPRQIFRFVFGKGFSFAYAILENIATDSTENYFRMSDFLYLTLQCFNGDGNSGIMTIRLFNLIPLWSSFFQTKRYPTQRRGYENKNLALLSNIPRALLNTWFILRPFRFRWFNIKLSG